MVLLVEYVSAKDQIMRTCLASSAVAERDENTRKYVERFQK
jgi:hypothetical protein